MLAAALVVLLAAGLAAFTYLRLERLGRRAWCRWSARAVAWSALGLLLLNVSCPAAGRPRAATRAARRLAQHGAPGGRWAEARDSALRAGEVRTVRRRAARPATPCPTRGRSLLRPGAHRRRGVDRPVIVVTDGEIEDAGDLPPELLGRAAVAAVSPAAAARPGATRVAGPSRVTAGDSIVLDVEVQAVAGARGGQSRGRGRFGQQDGGEPETPTRAQARRPESPHRLPVRRRSVPGDHVLRVRLAGAGDAEPRTDTRLHLVTVAPTPGVVLLAAPADWDSRFLYRTLRDVAQLPVRGYVRLDGDRWRSMSDLSTVGAERVRQAARGADLLILKGDPGRWREGSARARDLALAQRGDRRRADSGRLVSRRRPTSRRSPARFWASRWIPSRRPPSWRRSSPAPATGSASRPSSGGGARLGPPSIGREEGRVRSVTVAADGLWRWAFRGGSSEQSYRTWVASTASWLLGGADSARGVASPVRPVVQNGRPLVFEWTAAGRGGGVAGGLDRPGRAARRHAALRRRRPGQRPAAAGRVPLPLRGWRRRDGGGGGVLGRAAPVSGRP